MGQKISTTDSPSHVEHHDIYEQRTLPVSSFLSYRLGQCCMQNLRQLSSAYMVKKKQSMPRPSPSHSLPSHHHDATSRPSSKPAGWRHKVAVEGIEVFYQTFTLIKAWKRVQKL